jgi:hypothetical protein
MGWLDAVEDTNFCPCRLSTTVLSFSRYCSGSTALPCHLTSLECVNKIGTLLGSVTRFVVIYVTCQCVNATFVQIQYCLTALVLKRHCIVLWNG